MTWPLFDANTQVLVQGMTGREGSRMAAWMIATGTRIVAGVTPGGGGKDVEGRPVFNGVREARERFPGATTSCVVVPGLHVLSAVREGIETGVTFFHVITERVPVRDVMEIRRLAHENGVMILGPSSVGYLQFPRFRLGYLGGHNPFASLKEGGLAVLSGSGGMANETLMAFARQGIGVRLAMAVGGDLLNGCSLLEAVRAVDMRDDVTGMAVFVEPGNPLLRCLMSGMVKPEHPLVLCLPGDALESLPRGMPYGHAGTVLGEEDGRLSDLRNRMTELGYRCTALHDEFVGWCKSFSV
jgi:succinyl-CoA synthetase alpha subunit